MIFDKHNKVTKRAMEDNVINSMDTSSLSHSSNLLPVVKELDDSPAAFVKSRGTNLSLNEPLVRHSVEPQLLSENRRYSFDHTETARKMIKKD
jgi:hypothetical protein